MKNKIDLCLLALKTLLEDDPKELPETRKAVIHLINESLFKDVPSTKSAPKGCGKHITAMNGPDWICGEDGFICVKCQNQDKSEGGVK